MVALVALNVGLALAFVLGYIRLACPCEQRSFGVLGAFLVALYAETYGFPLTIYLLTVVLGRAPFPTPSLTAAETSSPACRG